MIQAESLRNQTTKIMITSFGPNCTIFSKFVKVFLRQLRHIDKMPVYLPGSFALISATTDILGAGLSFEALASVG